MIRIEAMIDSDQESWLIGIGAMIDSDELSWLIVIKVILEPAKVLIDPAWSHDWFGSGVLIDRDWNFD